ncbi:chymotrypsin-2-like [Phlebotomus argentipes]|uniref:chymotrypsin-2-like n=1 Tax=Phlebotomus argentipes TaxID=94469 RepID=UPI0028936807|nr:chymotrypsin-2-like [Phlebotomus argentipes]
MKTVACLAVLLSLLLVKAFASPLIDNRILGGSDAAAGQFPFSVSLRTLLNTHFCGGCILNERWVLTSGHCMMGRDQDAINIVAGSHLRTSGGLVFRSSRIFTHPNFNFNLMANDVSLILVTTPFFWTNNIQPISLGNSDVAGGVTATLIGWGWTSNPGSLSDALQWLPTVTLTQDECRSRHVLAQRPFIHENTLCTSNPFGQGMCMADTGGPVIIGNHVVGVKSWSVQCGLVPDIHARVSTHHEWIVSLTEAPIHELP